MNVSTVLRRRIIKSVMWAPLAKRRMEVKELVISHSAGGLRSYILITTYREIPLAVCRAPDKTSGMFVRFRFILAEGRLGA